MNSDPFSIFSSETPVKERFAPLFSILSLRGVLKRTESMSGVKYNFDWDPNKASSNLLKHGLSFDEVTHYER